MTGSAVLFIFKSGRAAKRQVEANIEAGLILTDDG